MTETNLTTCKRCLLDFPVGDFALKSQGKGKLPKARPYCKPCFSITYSKWKADNREKLKVYHGNWYQLNKAKVSAQKAERRRQNQEKQEVKNRKKLPALNDIQKNEICLRYTAGEGLQDLANAFGVSIPSIHKCLIGAGIPRRTSGRKYQYSCDHEYFSDINTEGKAYWLGFLAADGDITQTKTLRIGLSQIDSGHLEKFKLAIKSNHKIRNYTAKQGNHVVSMQITSPQMITDLAIFGIVPRKTFTLPFPLLRHDLMRHFIRGYSDGDGGFSFSSKKKYAVNFRVTSNRQFITDMQKAIMRACGLSRTKLQVRHPLQPEICSLQYGGRRQMKVIRDWLYEGATIWLERKLDKLNQSLNH